jgi:hypothetical protein
MSSQGIFESEPAYARRLAREAADDAARSDERIRRSVVDTDKRIDALTRQVEFLSRAFEAFVELSDVRVELARFVPAAAARAVVRPFIRGLASEGGPVPAPAEPADVPGYWLPRAASGLALLLRADPAAEAHLATASARDAERTALFLVLALRLAAAAELAEPHLAAALRPAPPNGAVTVATRHLWCALADGHYGSAGRSVLAHWLGQFVESGSTADLRAAVEARREPVPAERFGPFPRPVLGPRVPRSTAIEAALKSAASAAASLALLDRWYGAEPADASGAAGADIAAGGAAGGAAASATDGAGVAGGAGVADCAAVISMLVDEGSPEEGALLRRAAELEALARTRTVPAPTPSWDEPAGDGRHLVVADLLAADPELAGRRELARAALCRPVARLAEALLADATVDTPTQMTFPVEDESFTLAYDRSPDEDIARIGAAIDRRAAEAGARGNRKYAADQVRRAADRKAELATLIGSAGERLIDYRAQAAAIRAAAQTSVQSLMHRVGRVAEHTNTSPDDGS